MHKKLLHIIILSCKKATLLIEKKLHTRLNYRERLQLACHTVICNHCARYGKQAALIDQALKQPSTDIAVAEETFSPQEVEQLQTRILHAIEK